MSDKFSDYPQYDNDTTTDCEDCEARIRAEAIDECIDIVKKYGGSSSLTTELKARMKKTKAMNNNCRKEMK